MVDFASHGKTKKAKWEILATDGWTSGWSQSSWKASRVIPSRVRIPDRLFSLWSVRLMVRTMGFHPVNMGSIPVQTENCHCSIAVMHCPCNAGDDSSNLSGGLGASSNVRTPDFGSRDWGSNPYVPDLPTWPNGKALHSYCSDYWFKSNRWYCGM